MLRPRASWIAASALACLAVVAGGVGCSEPDRPGADEIAVYDFARDLAVAETARERSRLPVEDPAFERSMGSGWGPAETGDDGRSFRWMLGDRAELDVFVARPRDVTLVCACQPFHWPGAPPLEIHVEIGGHVGAAVAMTGAETSLSIPAAAWRQGRNRVVLRASRATAPADVIDGSDDLRMLALRAESLAFRGLLDALPPDALPPDADGSWLRLPAGSSVTTYGESAGQRWRLAEIDTRGDVKLGVYLHSEAGRVSLEPGPLDVPRGEPLAVELVAEPVDPPWWSPASWHGLFGEADTAGEVRVRGAQVLLSRDLMPAPAIPRDASGGAGARPEISAVVVYMIDTLRADRLGVYGSDRGLTPNLDALAEEAVVFTEARAQSSWTRPSVVSLLTGLYPQSHGIAERDDGLADGVETLSERLVREGMATGGIITNGNVSHRFGVGQGFEEYRYLQERSQRESVHHLADSLHRWALWWIDQHLGTTTKEGLRKPFFLYLHATDPHAPYTPPEPFATRFADGADRSLGSLDSVRSLEVRSETETETETEPSLASVRHQLAALYDAEVAWTDHQIGLFFDELRRRDLWDETLLVVVSDHGEEFLDHGGWEHGNSLYDEQLLVPLLVKLPRSADDDSPEHSGRRIPGPAGHVDVMPTILDALGLEYDPSQFDGRSLWPALVGAAERSPGAMPLGHLELSRHSLRSLAYGPWKLIDDLAHDDRELFELPADPAEQRNLSELRRLRAGVLSQERRRLEQALAERAATADAVELDEETREQLEALGYAGD